MAAAKKMRVKLFLVAAAAVLVLFAALAMLLLRFAVPKAEDRLALVYSRGGGQLLLQTRRRTVALNASQSKQQVFSADGGVLFYDAVTEEGLELYVCAPEDKKSRQSGGVCFAQGIAAPWSAETGGRYAVFLEAKGDRLFCYDRESGKAVELSEHVERLYAAPGQATFFFTKLEGAQRLVFRCAMGRQPERMSAGAEEPHFYADAEKSILLYTVKEAEGLQSLCALGQVGAVTQITKNPVKVFFEHYVLGGNLYYLQSGQETAGTAVVVEDPLQTADALLKEPRREEYWSGLLGGIFGSAAYEKDMRTYEEKLERDALRTEIKRILQELPNHIARQDCYVFDGVRSTRLAAGVGEDDLLHLRTGGRPMAIFEKFRVVKQEDTKTVTLEELRHLSNSGGSGAVRDYLSRLGQESIRSAGYYLAQLTATGANEIQFAKEIAAKDWETSFLEVPEVLLFLAKDVVGGKSTLYAYDLMDYGISERRMVDSGVTELMVAAQGAYYRKAEAGASKSSLYFYDGKQGAKVAHDVDAFFFAEGRRRMVVFSEVRDQLGKLSVCEGAAVFPVAEQVRVNSAKPGGAALYYLVAQPDGRGLLYAFRPEGKPTALDTDVADIIAVG